MSEVRFKIEGELQAQLAELKQVGGFDSLGAVVKSLCNIYCNPTLEAIKRGQAAIASGGSHLRPASAPAPIQTQQLTPPAPGGFGESLGSLLKA